MSFFNYLTATNFIHGFTDLTDLRIKMQSLEFVNPLNP
jgi:hypothetical protein